MSKFAKLFEIAGDQVLLFTEYEADTDETTVHQITTVDGLRADIKFSFHGDTQVSDATRYLDQFQAENAQKLREMVVGMFNG